MAEGVGGGAGIVEAQVSRDQKDGIEIRYGTKLTPECAFRNVESPDSIGSRLRIPKWQKDCLTPFLMTPFLMTPFLTATTWPRCLGPFSLDSGGRIKQSSLYRLQP